MLIGPLLCEQSTEGFEPLGAFNQPVFRSHAQIRAALLNELGLPCADYFARPEFDQGAGVIRWFAHPAGVARRWVDLPAEEQTRLDPIRQSMTERFETYRVSLDAAPENSPRSNFGKLLAQAGRVPGMQYLYFVGDQPVIAFWGFKAAAAREAVDPLRLAPGSAMLKPNIAAAGAGGNAGGGTRVPTGLPSRSGRWWRWLLGILGLLLLLLAILAFLAWRSGWPLDPRLALGLPLRPTFVTGGPRPDLAGVPDEAGRRAVPGATLPGAALPGTTLPGTTLPGAEAAGGAGPGTTGEGALRPGPAEAEKAAGSAGVEPDRPAARDAIPHGPDATGPIPANPPDKQAEGAARTTNPDLPALPPPGATAQRGSPLAIPEGARPGPADFVQGVWRSRSGLMLNGKPAEEYYRFDRSGQGDVTIRSRDGTMQCSGPAAAVVGPDRQLRFQEATLLGCSDGSAVSGAVTECRQSGDAAACAGKNESNGSRFGVRVERAGEK